jgi:hypothetical protein
MSVMMAADNAAPASVQTEVSTSPKARDAMRRCQLTDATPGGCAGAAWCVSCLLLAAGNGMGGRGAAETRKLFCGSGLQNSDGPRRWCGRGSQVCGESCCCCGGVSAPAGEAPAVAGKAPAAAGEPSAVAGGHDADAGKLGTGAGYLTRRREKETVSRGPSTISREKPPQARRRLPTWRGRLVKARVEDSLSRGK